jgi:hypothetical protein
MYIQPWVRELDFAIDTTWAKQGSVQYIDTVGGHDDLDVLGRLEPVELVILMVVVPGSAIRALFVGPRYLRLVHPRRGPHQSSPPRR